MNMIERASTPNTLVNLRVRARLTRRELANLAGVSEKTMANMENGLSVNLVSAQKVLDVLNERLQLDTPLLLRDIDGLSVR